MLRPQVNAEALCGKQPSRGNVDSIACSGCGYDAGCRLAGSACPKCGSTARTITITLNDAIVVADDLSGTRSNESGQLNAFFESGSDEMWRAGSVEQDETIHIALGGAPPQNEEDSDKVISLLAAHLSSGGDAKWSLAGPGNGNDDFILVRAAEKPETVGVQVVRALVDPRFWSTLRKEGAINDFRISLAEGADGMMAAVRLKAAPEKIPFGQRSTMILALDAFRLPALALPGVRDAVRTRHASELNAAGFRGIYVIGPKPDFVHRLDG